MTVLKVPEPSPAVFVITLWWWLGSSFLYTITTRGALQVFPFPAIVATLQLGVGLLYCVPVWILGFRRPPQVTSEQIKTIVHGGAWQAIAHLTITIASGWAQPTTVQTLHAAEPLFCVLLTWLIAGENIHRLTVPLLLALMMGIKLALGATSIHEPLEGGTPTVLLLMACSNCASALKGMTARSSIATQSRGSKKGPKLSAANLQALMSYTAFLFLIPISFIVEGYGAAVWFRSSVGREKCVWLLANVLASAVAFFLVNEMAVVAQVKYGVVFSSAMNALRGMLIMIGTACCLSLNITKLQYIGAGIAFLSAAGYTSISHYFPGRVPIKVIASSKVDHLHEAVKSKSE